MRSYLEQHGKPVALYSDKAGVFRVNKKEPQDGAGVTQFSRALGSRRIDILCANTPAAKGRVERAHLTLQDRRVKEYRLRVIRDIEAARAARGQKVGIEEREDGLLSFWHGEHAWLATAFPEEHGVQQGEDVENKRLSAMLDFIKEQQRKRT